MQNHRNQPLFPQPIYHHFAWSGSQWQQAKQSSPDIPLSSYVLLLFLGDPEIFPSQMGYILPAGYPRSIQRSPLSCTEYLHRAILIRCQLYNKSNGFLQFCSKPPIFSHCQPMKEAHLSSTE